MKHMRIKSILLTLGLAAAAPAMAAGKQPPPIENWIHKPMTVGETRVFGHIQLLDSTPESQKAGVLDAGVAKGTGFGLGVEHVLSEDWVIGATANSYQYNKQYSSTTDRNFGVYLSQPVYTDDFFYVYGLGGLSYHEIVLFSGAEKAKMGFLDGGVGVRIPVVDKLQVGFETRYSVVINPIKGINIEYGGYTAIQSFKFRTWQFGLNLTYSL